MKILKNILKYSVFTGLFLVPFIPFIVPQAMFFPFITGKGFVFRILVEIIFGLFVVLALFDKEYRPRFSWITKSVLLFTLVTFIADILGVNPYKSLWSNYERMEGFVLILHLALYYIVCSSVFNNRTKWNWFFNTSILASLAMSLYAILQAAGSLVINQGGDRVDGTFGNASYFAIYLVFHIFISLYLALDKARPTWQKWAYGGVALLEIVILTLTATRGAVLGLIGGLILSGLLIIWKERENPFYKKLGFGVIIALVLVVGIFFSIRNTSYIKTSPVFSRFANLGLSDIKTQGRYFVWPMAVKGFVERPILGWGQENFNFVFNKYYDPRMYGQEQWFDRTHNVFLDWLIAGGILGFISYFSMYFFLLYYIWRKESDMALSEKSVLTGLISAYLFHNIFVFDNLVSYIFFFSVLAYVHSVSIKEPRFGKFYEKTFSETSVGFVVLPAVVLVIGFSIYFINVPALSANRTLIKAITPQGDVNKNLAFFKEVYARDSFGSTEATEQLVSLTSDVFSSQLPDSVKQEFYNTAKQKIEEKVSETPNDARYLVFAGSFFNRFSQYDEAIKYLEPALLASPKKQAIYFEIGTSYIGKGNIPKAFEFFKKAYDLEPSSPESKIIYAVGAIYAKNNAVLQEMSGKIDQNIIIGDNRFLQAYANIGDYQNVINILNERLKNDPKNPQNKLSLASAYASIGQKNKAISLIQEVINENPDFKTQGEQYIKQIETQ